MSTHEILIVALVTAFVVTLTFTFLGATIFDSLHMVGAGFVSLIVIFTIFACSVKPGQPSWSTMRPIVKEASAFPHRPPAIAAESGTPADRWSVGNIQALGAAQARGVRQAPH